MVVMRMHDVAVPPLFGDRQRLQDIGNGLSGQYRSAEPFPHVVLDGFFPASLLEPVILEFPKPGEIPWERFDNELERKLACGDETRMGPHTRQLIALLNSSSFIGFLEAITGITGIIPDPHAWGGGLHQIERGGLLKVHADFNRYDRLRLDRRLNLLLYLNKDWQESYGGHLELWDRGMTTAVQRLLPVFNRCVVFNTSDHAYHGHPDPLNCPEHMTRKSLALYYYTNGRPEEEGSRPHSTVFKRRPGELWRKPVFDAIKRCLPPIVVDGIQYLRGKSN